MATRKTDWQYSQAKKLLEQDLRNGTIPLDSSVMGPKEVFVQCPKFAEFDYDRFRDRLQDLRHRLTEQNDRSASDMNALAHDRRIHPTPTHNSQGDPRWHSSAAEWLLKLDIDQDKQHAMKPKALFEMKNQYGLHHLKVFCKHIYQEVGQRKFVAQHQAHQNKKKS